MKVHVKLFGPEARAAGAREIAVDIPDGSTAGALRSAIADSCPALAASAPTIRIAVNCEFIDDDAPIGSDDEVALIGQVSGG